MWGQKLGCESALVQAKLGHDLRPYFDDTVRAVLPERLQTLVDQMLGYAEYSPVDDGPDTSVVSGSVGDWHPVGRSDLATAFLDDAPFAFRAN